MSQENDLPAEPSATREADGSFQVLNVPNSPGDHGHKLSVECPLCHRTLSVVAFGRNILAQHAKVEARRLALLAHYRTDLTDHAPRKRAKEN